MSRNPYQARFEIPGCFWIFLILLLLGGPRLVGSMIFFLFFALLILVLVAGAGFLLFFRSLNLNEYLKSQTEAHNRFVEYLVRFMVRMADVDGVVDESELQVIRSFFSTHMRYGPTQMHWIERLIKNSREKNVPLEELCFNFKSRFGIDEKRMLVQILYLVALADGKIRDSEQRLIDRIVSRIDFPSFEHDAIKRTLLRESKDLDPYKVLGLSAGAGKDEIKRRYRELSKENHPDRVAHLGEEFREIAEKKMAEINRAYDTLKKQGKA
jgi:DnaJ like chaperone protein